MTRAPLYIIFLLLWLPEVRAQTPEETLDQIHRLKYSAPRKAVVLLEKHASNSVDADKNEQLALHFQRFRLYIKLGNNAKAAEVIQQSQKNLHDAANFDAWIAIMSAYLKLIDFKTDDVRNTLKPFVLLYEQGKDPNLSMWYHFIEGVLNVRENNYDEAFTYLNSVHELAQALDNESVDMAVLDQFANISYYMQNYDKALEYNQALFQKASALGDKFTIAKTMSSDMNIYYMKSLAARDSVNDNSDEIEKKQAKEKQKAHAQKAEALEKDLLTFSRQIGAFKLEIRALINKQNRLLQQKNYTDTIQVAKRAVELANNHALTFEEAVSHNNMAIAFRALKKHGESIAALKKAEAGYALINNEQYNLWILEDYALAYEANKQFDEALEYYKKFHLADLNLLKKTNSKTVLELQEKFDSLQKEKEIKRLSHENELKQTKIANQRLQIFLFTSLGFAILLITFLQYNRNVTIARKNKKLDVLNRRLKDLSLKDPLTGLYNRRMLEELEDQFANHCLLDTSVEYDREISIGIVMLDIDNFKSVNDTYGHDTGDEVIKHISREISAELRRGDIAIRLGGEEFLVVLLGIDEQGISSFCGRLLHKRNENPITIGEHTLDITSSLGYIVLPFTQDNSALSAWEETIKIADSLLYQAKRKGRNRAETLIFANNLKSLNKKFIIESLIDNLDNLPESVQPKTLTYPIAC